MLVLEKATKEDRGGNSAFTAGGFRFCHDGVEDLRTDILDDMTSGEYESIGNLPPLSEEQFMEILMRITEHQADEDLGRILIGQSRDVMLGGGALFSLAAGMSVPLLLVGLSALSDVYPTGAEHASRVTPSAP
mgnify:CR=1 FL=1